MLTKRKLVVGGVAVAVAAITIIIIAQGANLQKPVDIVQQEPSEQTGISLAETVTIIIPKGGASWGNGSNE